MTQSLIYQSHILSPHLFGICLQQRESSNTGLGGGSIDMMETLPSPFSAEDVLVFGENQLMSEEPLIEAEP